MKSSALLLCRELLAFYEYVICKKLLPVRLLTVFLLCFSDDGIYLGAGTISGSVSVYVSFNLSVNYIVIIIVTRSVHLLGFTSGVCVILATVPREGVAQHLRDRSVFRASTHGGSDGQERLLPSQHFR